MYPTPDLNYVMGLVAQNRHLEALDISVKILFKSDFQDNSLITLCMFLLDTERQTSKAIDILQRVCALNYSPKWLIALAEKYRSIGNIEAALETIEKVLQREPGNLAALAHRACWKGSLLGDSIATRLLFENWGSRFQAQYLPIRNFSQDIGSKREPKLRLGYISGDLKNHSVRYFIEPFLRFHNRNNFEIHAFMTMSTDDISLILKNYCDAWHDVQFLNEINLFNYIRSKKIDILVDLSGHTKGERLAVFAMRAAPVQVTWFGFMQTLGLSEIDWRLTDFGATPEGSEEFYTEKLYRLSSMVAYAPPFDTENDFVAPWHENGFITMICLNDSRKFNDELLSTFSTILKLNENSGLILISREEVSDLDHSLLKRLEIHDLPLDRTTIIGRQNMRSFMQLSKVADFALDSFPVSGGTTTLHALWMGLPTISLDNTAKGGLNGAGAGIMRAAGMDDCVASDINGYVNLAGSLIKNPENVDALRQRCRIGLKNSPLMDYEARVKEVEDAYRYMWQNYLNNSMA